MLLVTGQLQRFLGLLNEHFREIFTTAQPLEIVFFRGSYRQYALVFFSKTTKIDSLAWPFTPFDFVSEYRANLQLVETVHVDIVHSFVPDI